MEDSDTGDCIDSDSSTDGNGNNVMYGARTNRSLRSKVEGQRTKDEGRRR